MSSSHLTHRYPVKVNPYEIDPSYKANILSINNILDQGGMSHISHLGLSMNKLREKGYGWALYQRDIHIHHDLEFDKAYNIETKITGRQRIFTYRDYYILDAENRICVESSSIWILFDLQARSFVKEYPDEFKKLIDPGNEIAHLPRPQKIRSKVVGQGDYSYSTQVKYSDIDILGHLSNHHHIKMMYDVLPKSVYDTHRVKSFKSNFISEAAYGDQILIKAEKEDLRFVVSSSSGEKVLGRGVFDMEKKGEEV